MSLTKRAQQDMLLDMSKFLFFYTNHDHANCIEFFFYKKPPFTLFVGQFCVHVILNAFFSTSSGFFYLNK